MDRNKIDQQLDRRMEKMDLKEAVNSGREPITDYNRFSFRSKVYYEDAVLDARVLNCKERINDTFRNIRCEGFGPWILFSIIDIEEGDLNANLCPGAAVMARWDNTVKYIGNISIRKTPSPMI